MKKIAFLIVCFCNVTAFGQNGFFLQPEAGFGLTGVHVSKYELGLFNNGTYHTDAPTKSPAYIFQLLVGYQHNRWLFTTGLSMAKTGYRGGYETGDFVYEYVSEQQYYYHALLPLTVGYRINAGHRFSIIPTLGGAVSYNYSSIYYENEWLTPNHGSDRGSKHTLSSNDFNNQYYRICAWGLAKLEAGYKISDKITIVAGPELQYSLTQLTKEYYASNDPYYFKGQKNYAYTFNAGVKWNLHASKR